MSARPAVRVATTGWGGALYTRGMRPVCFLSDFGLADDFAGTCKGVMLRIAPDVSIVDLTHEVPGFEVEAGAEILQHATRYMPADTVYLAVVDPGVGTKRRELALRTESGALLVGPDNGLLVPAAESLGGISAACALTEERFHLHPVSSTFHGRDVFAPVAAHLAAGVGLSDLGEPVDPSSLMRLRPVSVQVDEGAGLVTRIISVDRFGNARLSIMHEELGLEYGDDPKVSTYRTDIAPSPTSTFRASPYSSPNSSCMMESLALPNRSTEMMRVTRPAPSSTNTLAGLRRISEEGSTGSPRSENSTPAARWAATGAKTSRP